MTTPESPKVSHIVATAFDMTTRKTFYFFPVMIFINDTTEADDEEQEDNRECNNHI